MAVKVVVFDVGETLVDESGYWGSVADAYGIPRLTFFGVFGAVIAAGDDHRRVFDVFGLAPREGERVYTLYEDVPVALTMLRGRGYRIGIAANQPEWAEAALRMAGVRADFVGLSSSWGVHKPSPEFFERVARAAEVAPSDIAYVGDRVDNDVLPAKRAGMVAVHVRRGPWGWIQSGRDAADVCVDSLTDIAEVLERV